MAVTVEVARSKVSGKFETEADAMAIRIKRGRPFGADQWVARTASASDLQSTLRLQGARNKVKSKIPVLPTLLNWLGK